VDVNRLQADGPTADVLHTEPIDDKWVAFGWQAWRVDGNDLSALLGEARSPPHVLAEPHKMERGDEEPGRQAEGAPACDYLGAAGSVAA
jgi:hypothetical protein